MTDYWNAGTDEDLGLDFQRNEWLEIGYLAAGKLPFCVGNEHYQVDHGGFTIMLP